MSMDTGVQPEYDWEALRRESQVLLKANPTVTYRAPSGKNMPCFYDRGETVNADGEVTGIGCFFGQVFDILGYDELRDGRVGISQILDENFDPSDDFHSDTYREYHDFYTWAAEMQSAQDDGHTWAEANRRGEEAVWEKYNGRI